VDPDAARNFSLGPKKKDAQVGSSLLNVSVSNTFEKVRKARNGGKESGGASYGQGYSSGPAKPETGGVLEKRSKNGGDSSGTVSKRSAREKMVRTWGARTEGGGT